MATHRAGYLNPQRIVVIGASAGGIEALQKLASQLPRDFAAPICVVVHTAPDSPGLLPSILRSAGPLPAEHANNGVRLQPGRFYVAPPDRHLLVRRHGLQVSKGPRENRFRPAVDPLFRSAAQVFGPAVIGIVLTGGLDDGTAGLHAIKQLGGVAVVQDPRDAQYPSMPTNAARYVAVDHLVPINEMGALLMQLLRTPRTDVVAQLPRSLEVEVNVAGGQNPIDAGLEDLGAPSSFACPECHGVLLQVGEGGILRFRCHTGHAYTAEALVAAISDSMEDTLFSAVRALEEAQLLLHQIADHVRQHDAHAAIDLEQQSHAAGADAESVRQVAIHRNTLVTTKD